MPKWIGNRFGNVVSVDTGQAGAPAIYNMSDQYYAKQQNAWGIINSGLTATGGIISDYTSGSYVYRSHIFTGSGEFNVTDLGNIGTTVDVLVVGSGGGGGTSGGGGGGGGVRSVSYTHLTLPTTPYV